MATKTLSVETVAQAYLELLQDRGVDCFFANAGTDFASIVDAFARFAAEGRATPRPIAVPHEFVAVSMAHGYYLVTGRPQVVMVHVTVGTANGIGAIINAARAQVPVLFTAGRTPITETGGLPGVRDTHIHWAQEPSTRPGCSASTSSGTTSSGSRSSSRPSWIGPSSSRWPSRAGPSTSRCPGRCWRSPSAS